MNSDLFGFGILWQVLGNWWLRIESTSEIQLVDVFELCRNFQVARCSRVDCMNLSIVATYALYSIWYWINKFLYSMLNFSLNLLLNKTLDFLVLHLYCLYWVAYGLEKGQGTVRFLIPLNKACGRPGPLQVDRVYEVHYSINDPHVMKFIEI